MSDLDTEVIDNLARLLNRASYNDHQAEVRGYSHPRALETVAIRWAVDELRELYPDEVEAAEQFESERASRKMGAK